MKLKLSSHSPLICNIFGVGSFFIFLALYVFVLRPFFYATDYLIFSYNKNKSPENEREAAEFAVMPDGEIKDFILSQSNRLENVQLNCLEYGLDDTLFLLNEKKNQLFVELEYVKSVPFSDLVNTKQYMKLYYQSYIIFLDKKSNCLRLKENPIVIHDGESFDNNLIDSIKMKMDKINYDFQLESERWYGRFIQRNRQVISEIVTFINNSALPEILKNDVILISEDNSLILDYEDYLKELIGTLENASPQNVYYKNELDFLRGKYAQLYKIKSGNKINGAKLSVYDFFKTNDVFVSDDLKLVTDKKFLVQKDFLNDFLGTATVTIKKVGNYFLLTSDRNLKLINNRGELLKDSSSFFESRLFGVLILCFIFLISFLNKKIFVLLELLAFVFIVFFGEMFLCRKRFNDYIFDLL